MGVSYCWREPLGKRCGTIDEFVVLAVWLHDDLVGGAESGGVVDHVEPLVERLFLSGEADLHLGAVVVGSAVIRGKKFLGLDGEPEGAGLGFGELLELVLVFLVVAFHKSTLIHLEHVLPLVILFLLFLLLLFFLFLFLQSLSFIFILLHFLFLHLLIKSIQFTSFYSYSSFL